MYPFLFFREFYDNGIVSIDRTVKRYDLGYAVSGFFGFSVYSFFCSLIAAFFTSYPYLSKVALHHGCLGLIGYTLGCLDHPALFVANRLVSFFILAFPPFLVLVIKKKEPSITLMGNKWLSSLRIYGT